MTESWTIEQYEEWQEKNFGVHRRGRKRKTKSADNDSGEAAEPERSISNALDAAASIEPFNTQVSITLICYRHRLTDSDNPVGKFAIDGLVCAGLLHDDSPKFVKRTSYEQVEIGPEEAERTEIIIEEV